MDEFVYILSGEKEETMKAYKRLIAGTAAAVMLALFGGVTFWLYTAHNGDFILVGCIAALMAIAFMGFSGLI